MKPSSYAHLWRDGSSAMFDGQRLIDMILEAIDLYSSTGVKVNQSSKLYQATKVFKTASDGFVKAPLYVAVAKLAVEHLSIARMISSGGCSVDEVRTQLLHSLSGRVIWNDDVDRRSESFQFELFVASMFWAAGMKPQFREPDLLVEMSGETIGVASKYLFSAKKARKMSIRAVEQIRRSGYRGIIACGLNHFVAAVVEGRPKEDAGEPLDFSSVVPLIVDVDQEAEGQQGVIGRIAIIQTSAFQPDGGGAYIRRRVDARPYLEKFHSGAAADRLRWRAEMRQLQNRWSAATATMMTGKNG